PDAVLWLGCPAGGVRVTPRSGLVTTEAGGTATFDVVLTSKPQGDVTVTFTSADPSEGVVSTPTATFTYLDWNVPQTITVTGQPDALVDGAQPYQVTSAVTSADTGYDGRTVAPVSLTNLPGPPQVS